MKNPMTILPICIAVLLFTAGCLMVERDLLHNNSGQDLNVSVSYPGTNISTLLKHGGWIEFGSPFIEVRHGTGVWRYARKPSAFELNNSGRQLYRKGEGNQIVVNLQIEPDGNIYILSANSTGITTNFPRQPKGFPLSPSEH